MPSPAARSSLPPAEPGDTGPDATVLPFRERVPEQNDGRERDRVTDDPQDRLERYIQARFMADGHTLNDPDTADIFRTTIDAVSQIHDAALRQGVIDASQHETLSAWLHGLRLAPDGLSRRD